MKVKNVLLIALMAVSASVMATDKTTASKVVVISQKSGLFKVIYEGPGKVTLKIADSKGLVVFTESVKTENGFIRPVNFTGMEPGDYTITVSDENGQVVNKINYENQVPVKNVHVAKIAPEGKYLLAVANGTVDQINVRIFDGNNNLVHDEDLTIHGNFGLVYNLKAVEGTPTFQVTDKTGNALIVK
jgi:flagellar hook assembly protein FlgD